MIYYRASQGLYLQFHCSAKRIMLPRIICTHGSFCFHSKEIRRSEINPSLSFSTVGVNLSLKLKAGTGEVSICCTSFSWDNTQPAEEHAPCGTPAPSALPASPPAEPGPEPPRVPEGQWDSDTLKQQVLAEKHKEIGYLIRLPSFAQQI